MLHRNEKLDIKTLAQVLDWTEKDVSKVINDSFGTNFNDWINGYRVRDFKELILQPQNNKYSIIGVAQEAGFHSKTSFYRAFKKESGQTPSEFLQANGSMSLKS